MLRLLILRHAKAEPLPSGGEDHDRPLAPRGRSDAAHLGDFLVKHRLIPDYALLSSARRVQETWSHAAAAFGRQPASATVQDLYNATAQAIVAVVRKTPPGTRSAIVVGHNPGLHEAAVQLIASGDSGLRERLMEGFPTTGLAVIDFPADAWSSVGKRSGRLERFLTPRDLGPATD